MRNPDALNITRINTRASVQLKSWMPRGNTSVAAALMAPAGGRLLELAPGEWLLISDTLGPDVLRVHAREIERQGIAAVNVSPGLAAFSVEGLAAREIIENSCGLDLHPGKFPVGTCTRTRMAQLPVIIDAVGGAPRFELYVGRSYAVYLSSWLEDAALGFDAPKR